MIVLKMELEYGEACLIAALLQSAAKNTVIGGKSKMALVELGVKFTNQMEEQMKNGKPDPNQKTLF